MFNKLFGKKDDWFKKHPDDEGDFDFGKFGHAVNQGKGDKGQSFPQSDADDFQKGVRFVPGEVTLARRKGENVKFVQDCYNSCCWYWQFPDNKRIYHFERWNYEKLVEAGGKCPNCGNTHISGLSPT